MSTVAIIKTWLKDGIDIGQIRRKVFGQNVETMIVQAQQELAQENQIATQVAVQTTVAVTEPDNAPNDKDELTVETVRTFWSPDQTQESMLDEVLEEFPDENHGNVMTLVNQVIVENTVPKKEVSEPGP